jgi:hypothetical protein
MDGCWTWTGGVKGGRIKYGQLYLGFRKSDRTCVPEFAHRVSWVIHFGLIPDGLDVCHTCDNPICIRPDHFFLGTALDNARDCTSKDRYAHKFFNADRAEACRLYNEGRMTLRDIGQKFNVSLIYVDRIISAAGIKRTRKNAGRYGERTA